MIQKNFHHGPLRGFVAAPRTTFLGPPRHLVVGKGEAVTKSRWLSTSTGRRARIISFASKHTPEAKEKKKGTPDSKPRRVPPSVMRV